MAAPPPPFTAYEGQPEGTIERHGRCSYWVDIHWGMMGLSTAPWWRWSRKSAERKALREIRWWKARAAREPWPVSAPCLRPPPPPGTTTAGHAPPPPPPPP